jgi:hypothetical protein
MNWESLLSFGNIHFAVEKQVVSVQQLLNHVVTSKSNYLFIQLIPSLIIILRKVVTNNLYVDGQHLLSIFNEDGLLRYYFLKGGSDLPTHSNNPRVTLKGLIIEPKPTLLELMLSENINDEDTLKYFFDQKIITNDVIQLVYQTNCSTLMNAFQHYKLIPLSDIHKLLVQNDYPHLLPIFYDKEIYGLVLKRLQQVKHSLPQIYFEKLIQVYFEKWIDDPVFCQQIDDEHLKETLELFSEPLQINSFVNQIPELYYRFFLYPLPYKCYLLGYNLCLNVPSPDEILDKCKEFISKDTNVFIEEQLMIHSPKGTIVNPQDTMLEDPESYLPFDRMDYVEQGKVYRFTRTEFNTIVQTENNLWTNKKLPSYIIYSLCNKVTISDYYKLPPAAPYEELIEKALSGELIPKDMMESITQIQSSTSFTN